MLFLERREETSWQEFPLGSRKDTNGNRPALTWRGECPALPACPSLERVTRVSPYGHYSGLWMCVWTRDNENCIAHITLRAALRAITFLALIADRWKIAIIETDALVRNWWTKNERQLQSRMRATLNWINWNLINSGVKIRSRCPEWEMGQRGNAETTLADFISMLLIRLCGVYTSLAWATNSPRDDLGARCGYCEANFSRWCNHWNRANGSAVIVIIMAMDRFDVRWFLRMCGFSILLSTNNFLFSLFLLQKVFSWRHCVCILWITVKKVKKCFACLKNY